MKGTGSIVVGGPLTWDGGSIYNTVHFNGGSQSSGLNLYGGILVNTGTFDWNGTIYFYSGSSLTNLGSGTINLAAGANAAIEDGNNLDNDGQFNVPGPGSTSVGVPFNNFDTVAVSSGTLTLTDGGTETGLFTNAAAGTLDLGGGTFALNAGSSVVGAGNFMVSSGTANLAGSMDIEGTSTFSGGTANVTGACTITNVLVISGGALNLNGTGPITPVTATISGGAEAGSQTLQVLGSGGFTWDGGSIYNMVHFNGGTQSSSLNLYGGIAGPMLAHKAEEEGIAFAEQLVNGRSHVNYDTIPAVVYTHPDIASVGRTEEQLLEARVELRKGVFFFRANGRAHAISDTAGKIKILADAKTDQVLGVHILGPRAGDTIAEAVAAMAFGATSEAIARTCHAHLTLAEALKEAALAVHGRSIHS